MSPTRKLAAIMFTDIAGFTALSAHDEEKALELIDEQRRVLKPIVEEFNGEWLKEIGDGLLLSFPSSKQAVNCAIKIQQTIKDIEDLNLRIGIHQGDILEKDGDVFGDDVNIASRIEPFAAVGGVVITHKVQGDISSSPEFKLKFIGQPELKGVKQQIKIYCIASHGLPETEQSSLPAKPEEKDQQVKSIVVLPFEDISSGKDNEYFSDGLTEEITADLSQLNQLRVISRTSAVQLKGTKKAVNTIGRELGVQYVLEGSVRKAGNNLRITAQLIDSKNDDHLWAKKYVGTLDDVFDIQEQVSRSIVEALKLKLSPKEDQKIAARPIENMEAYECYLKARQETWLFTKDALDRAVQYLQNGLDIIGDNPALFAGMGYVYSQYVNMGIEHEVYLDKSEEYAEKALKLDPGSSEAHLVLGFVFMVFRGNLKKGFYHFKQALSNNPDDPHALLWLIVAQTSVGKTLDTCTLVERLEQVDPLTPMSRGIMGLLDLVEGRSDSAVKYVKKWLDMDPQNPAALFFNAQFLAYNRRFDDARALVAENVQVGWNDAFTQASLLVKFAVEGDIKRIEDQITGEMFKTWRRDHQFSYYIAGILALAGRKKAALDWLANAIDRGFINYPFIARYDQLIDPIRGESQFKNLLDKAKHEWEHFEA
ncbi:MAG: adenylate/guanylate cyclase domain-containing protein [Fidelibacterota bacterium]